MNDNNNKLLLLLLYIHTHTYIHKKHNTDIIKGVILYTNEILCSNSQININRSLTVLY
uniref:Uncharacterized protein n=1 Tax=Anguilla anguilla TaxID=7936 RepID=A0A0E9WA36_ANGAN